MVERLGTDYVILLFDHLPDDVWVHTLLAHCGVEMVQMLKEDFHCNSALLWQNASLPQACLYGAQDALAGLRLQHAGNYTQDTQ